MEVGRLRDERRLGIFNKGFIKRVEKKEIDCPVCDKFLMEASWANIDFKCPRCKKRLAILVGRRHYMVIEDRRITIK